MVIVEEKSGKLTRGMLGDMSEEGVRVLNVYDSLAHNGIPRADVSSIHYRKEGTIKRHILWGGLIGAGGGVLVSAITYEAHPCGFQLCVESGIGPLSAAFLGALAGVGGGALIGARYKEIELAGDPRKYETAVAFFQNPDPALEKDVRKRSTQKP